MWRRVLGCRTSTDLESALFALNSESKTMKKDIHPQFRDVVFKDVSCDYTLLTKSTVNSKETIDYNGKTYPLVKVDISSGSHPFYTGQQRLLDTEGRAEKFRKKYGRK